MLDAFIIEYVKRQEEQRNQIDRPQIQLPIPSEQTKIPDKPKIIIIEFSGPEL